MQKKPRPGLKSLTCLPASSQPLESLQYVNSEKPLQCVRNDRQTCLEIAVTAVTTAYSTTHAKIRLVSAGCWANLSSGTGFFFEMACLQISSRKQRRQLNSMLWGSLRCDLHTQKCKKCSKMLQRDQKGMYIRGLRAHRHWWSSCTLCRLYTSLHRTGSTREISCLEAGSIKHGHLDDTDCNKSSLRPGQLCDVFCPKVDALTKW